MSSNDRSASPGILRFGNGFDALDVCHRQTLFTLGKLAALISRLQQNSPDAQARALAGEVVRHFSTEARQHHEDEEQHVFPRLLGSADPQVVQAVLTLKQDHGWLEENWRELSPMLDAVASGQGWFELEVLREGAEVFTALSHAHIALEESYIYPLAKDLTAMADQWAMGREMAARHRARRLARARSET